ncbi:sodium:calcium antiporter [Methylomicrobium sp. RS1]|jgi:cation:H+ antiporter|uniref:sodium:calcium antiporter n=1 Tax=Candidatus Methylomicrobium oryzae TaxID=2802053 RepID=UPI001F1A86F7|nr:sodium:calcium antiporter [Methylomicrobium sp. RS1]
MMPNFAEYGLTINLAVFAAAAGAVGIAGTKIAAYADELAERLQLSRALLGLFLLAGVTSLSDIATSLSAAFNNNATLAVNNMLGGIAFQVALLAIADIFTGKRALTSVIPNPVVMLQGALVICLLTFVTMAVIVGDAPLFGAGIWSWGLLGASLFSFVKISEAEGRYPWIVNNPEDEALGKEDRSGQDESEFPLRRDPLARLIAKTAASALVILCAGYVLATVGDVIARQSGLGSSFVGMTLMSFATALPEASTVFASMYRGLYTMAISDILGSNIINVMLLFGIDAITPGDPVLSRVGNFSAIGALLGLAVTGLFLMGLAERANRTFFRMGRDSAAVLAVYGGGMVLLYSMRGSGGG